MRTLPVLAALALLVPALSVAPAATAETTALVDAGDSRLVRVGETFLLEGRTEALGEGASVAWTAPEGCLVDEPTLLVVAARCSAPGVHAFRLEASDGAGAVADEVRIAAFLERSVELLRATGRSDVGLPEEAAQPTFGGLVDKSTTRHSFSVAPGTGHIEATLSFTSREVQGRELHDFDLDLQKGPTHFSATGAGNPELVHVEEPAPGPWIARVDALTAVDAAWELVVESLEREGLVTLPALRVDPVIGTLGEPVTLEARVTGAESPYTLRWERDAASLAFDDGAGDSFTFVFNGATAVKARVTDARGFEATAFVPVREAIAAEPRPITVVAVIDSSFTPYHHDFTGDQHPWNVDADPANDLDLFADPASYIADHPGAEAVRVSLPDTAADEVESRRNGADAEAWGAFASSNLATGVEMVWFPGTKVVGAIRFGGEWYGGNSAHGTRSAASAAGNLHGTCPECLVVLISGDSNQALRWVAAQPWIDVVSNSYGHSVVGGAVRDNVYLASPRDATRAASEAGQTIVFSAGNGLLNAFDVPMFTYWSSEKGPDWMVTVGAVAPSSRSTYTGAGKPVDISSIGSGYPSSGGTTAAGTGAHSGTSNAAPTTAGTFAKVLQEARELLGDVTPGAHDGIVAEGEPVACGAAVPACALGDGVLTREELRDLVFHNVLPSATVVSVGTVMPTTPAAFHYQGHGVLAGRLDGDARWSAEWGRMVENARGDAPALERPAGEASWFVADSFCRQKVWGAWSGGYFQGVAPALGGPEDLAGLGLYAGCLGLQEDTVGLAG